MQGHGFCWALLIVLVVRHMCLRILTSWPLLHLSVWHKWLHFDSDNFHITYERTTGRRIEQKEPQTAVWFWENLGQEYGEIFQQKLPNRRVPHGPGMGWHQRPGMLRPWLGRTQCKQALRAKGVMDSKGGSWSCQLSMFPTASSFEEDLNDKFLWRHKGHLNSCGITKK